MSKVIINQRKCGKEGVIVVYFFQDFRLTDPLHKSLHLCQLRSTDTTRISFKVFNVMKIVGSESFLEILDSWSNHYLLLDRYGTHIRQQTFCAALLTGLQIWWLLMLWW